MPHENRGVRHEEGGVKHGGAKASQRQVQYVAGLLLRRRAAPDWPYVARWLNLHHGKVSALFFEDGVNFRTLRTMERQRMHELIEALTNAEPIASFARDAAAADADREKRRGRG